MVDPITAVTIAGLAATSIQQIWDLVQKIQKTIEGYTEGNYRLQLVAADLGNIFQSIDLIKRRKALLQTSNVLVVVETIKKVTKDIDAHVQYVHWKLTQGSRTRQVAHQYMKGPGEWEKLSALVVGLNSCKMTLMVAIQMANPALALDEDQVIAGDEFPSPTVDSAMLDEINQDVEDTFGNGNGLIMNGVCRGREPDDDGFIRLTKEEYDSIRTAEELLGISPQRTEESPAKISISKNCPYERAKQIVGLLGEVSWNNYLSGLNIAIEENNAHGGAVQVVGVGGKDAISGFFSMVNQSTTNQLAIAKMLARKERRGLEPIPAFARCLEDLPIRAMRTSCTSIVISNESQPVVVVPVWCIYEEPVGTGALMYAVNILHRLPGYGRSTSKWIFSVQVLKVLKLK